MIIDHDEIKLALASPDYVRSLVIVIGAVGGGWSCAYAAPLDAIAMLERICAMTKQDEGPKAAECVSKLNQIVAKGQTAILKYWQTRDSFGIILQEYNTEYLCELRATVVFS
jgi:hypothetical protein